jgi:hypothetical protein
MHGGKRYKLGRLSGEKERDVHQVGHGRSIRIHALKTKE